MAQEFLSHRLRNGLTLVAERMPGDFGYATANIRDTAAIDA